MYPENTERQALDALARSLDAVRQLGGDIGDVIRTRVFLAPRADWRVASKAHADLLGAVAPANTTLYVNQLIGLDFLVEVEIDAVVSGEVSND